MTFTLPIYYTQTFKTKPDKTFLIGMNWYNTAHYHIKNEVKQSLTTLITEQFENIGPVLGPYKVHYTLYWKNPSSDGSNIISLSEKIFLDAIQQGLVSEDNVKHHMGSTWTNAGQDKVNPRVEITIKDAEPMPIIKNSTTSTT